MSQKKETVKPNATEQKETSKVQATGKLEKFRAELKINKQLNPALRKIQVAVRAVQNLSKKSIMGEYNDFLKQVETNFKKIEDKLLSFIPD